MEQLRARETEISFTSEELRASIERHIRYIQAVLRDYHLPVGVMKDIRDRHQQIKTLATIRTLSESRKVQL